jgi:hypothetical protein
MNKFTPGPWEMGDDFQVQTVDKHGYEIAEMRIDVPEYEANARLIAAAPDLLEALENLENDSGSIPDHAWQRVKAAIALARGEV